MLVYDFLMDFFKKSLPWRRLIASALYLCSAGFFITNLCVGGAAGLSAVDLGLVIAGVSCWVIGGMHSVYGHAKTINRRHLPANEIPRDVFPKSSHAIFNASCYTLSAVFFILGDALNSSTPVSIRSTRLTGSSLWLLSALSYLLVAMLQERQQEQRPDEDVRFLGIRPEIIYFLCESEYLAAGFFYAAAIYLANPIPYFKAIGNGCWLLASTHETLRTWFGMFARTDHRIEVLPDNDDGLRATH